MSMRHSSNTIRISTLFSALIAVAASGVAARADQVVYFTNGKAITVKKVEKGDRLTILEIEGGGRIGIPTVQIEKIEELALTAMAAPPVAIPAILPAPQPEPQAANPAPPPAAAQARPQAAGPGTGGHVAPNSPVNGAQPLAFGGDPSEEGAAARPRTATQSTAPGAGANGGAMMRQGQRANMNMMNGGPGAWQRGRQGGRNGNNGRLPAAAYLPPKNDPNAGAPGGQPGAQNGQTGAAAPQPPAAGTQPAAPPAATTAPPPPPPPDPAETDPGSSDGSTDDGSGSETDTPAGDDGASGQN